MRNFSFRCRLEKHRLLEQANRLSLRFCDESGLKSEDAWITFAQYPEKAEAQAPFRGFLHRYVDDSVQIRVILGSEEYENKRMLDQAHSVVEIWRRLVASAEHRVFKPNRRNGGPEAATLKLRWISKDKGEREGPAFRIVKVSSHLFTYTSLFW